MKSLIAISTILLLTSTSFLFTQAKHDSLQTNQTGEDKLFKIEQLEKQIEDARSQREVQTEMIAIMDLIHFKIRNFGDYTSTYQELRYLEKLIEKNPNSKAIKQVETELNLYLGHILWYQSNIEEGITYMEKAIDASIKHDNKQFYRSASCHYFEMLSKLGKRKEAFKNFRRLERESFQNNDSLLRHRAYEAISSVYLYDVKKPDSALFYAKKSLDNFSSLNLRAYRNTRVAECYLALNKEIDSAIYYAQTGLTLAKSNNLQRELLLAHQYLANAYDRIEDYEMAYNHFKKFYELEQNQFSFDNALHVGTVNLDREKEASKLQQELAEERLSNQRLVIWIVSGGLLLLIVGLYYIFNRLKLIRKQKEIIEQEKLRAEQSERYKEQFLANMSHEIRTPMHAISGMVNALRRRDHSKEQGAYLDAMKISSDNLLVILNDILDMSKIESGSLEIAKLPLDVVEITNNVINLLSYKAQEKGVAINFNEPKDFPKAIQGDPVRLNQILVNLISNAIKFTEEGGININLTSDEHRLQFAIRDTGIGIPETSIEAIFDSFKQGEDTLNKRYSGTGLGLSITKKLIDLQGGKIWAESVQGEGSTFYFELPLLALKDVEIANENFTEQELKEFGKSLTGLKLLISEDNSFNIMVVKDDLTWYIPDVDLTFVENGKEAIEKFKESKFDVILMDVQMPEVNGYEATKEIRKLEIKEQRKKTPIIAMTASLLKDQIDKCYDAGMDAYIPKPYKPNNLLTTIKEIEAAT